MNIEDKLNKYKSELDKVVNEMKLIGEKIDQLNNQGMELTAQANVLAGKIEVLEELKESEGNKNEE